MLFEWDERYSVGHKELDAQHKEWLSIINDLHVRLVSGDVLGLDQVTTEALKAVIRYGEKHFAFEEKLMEEAGYEHLVYHRKLHTDFLGRIIGLYERHRNGEIVLNSQLMKTLQSWLTEHILSEDKKYAQKLESFS